MTTGSVFKNFVYLQDRGANPLWNGSLVKCFCNQEKYSTGVHQGYQTTMQPPVPDFVGSNVGSVWQTEVGNNNFTGIDNPQITIGGGWITDLGSYEGTVPILTPYKIIVMAASGRQFHMTDERIIKQIAIESGSQFYGQYGIPVVITDYSLNANGASDLNSVNWSMTLREDKI